MNLYSKVTIEGPIFTDEENENMFKKLNDVIDGTFTYHKKAMKANPNEHQKITGLSQRLEFIKMKSVLIRAHVKY
jgi:ketol-acid reductoisomerase